MKLIPCKHLDYSDNYVESCVLRNAAPHFPHVRYWERTVVPYEGAPVKVQFCGQGRGRINSVFNCYEWGCMPCYEPEQTA